MDHNQVRAKILTFLYNRFLVDQEGEGDWEELSRELDIPVKQISHNVLRLSQEEFLEQGMSHTCRIRKKGVRYAEGPGPFNEQFENVFISFNQGDNSVLMTGSVFGNASQFSQHNGLTPEASLQLIKEIIQASNEPPEKKGKLINRIVDTAKQKGPQAAYDLAISGLSGIFF